jgi:hypothetical protein
VPEELRLGAHPGDVHEDPGHEPDLLEGRAIVAEGGVLLHGAGDVGEYRPREVLLGGALEVVEREDLPEVHAAQSSGTAMNSGSASARAEYATSAGYRAAGISCEL